MNSECTFVRKISPQCVRISYLELEYRNQRIRLTVITEYGGALLMLSSSSAEEKQSHKTLIRNISQTENHSMP